MVEGGLHWQEIREAKIQGIRAISLVHIPSNAALLHSRQVHQSAQNRHGETDSAPSVTGWLQDQDCHRHP